MKLQLLLCALLCLIAGLIYPPPLPAQDTRKALLIHSRYDHKDSTNEYLVAYIFTNGVFEKRDTILHTFRYPGSRTDGRISVGFGPEPLLYNRYLFTGIGLLIDCREKKVLRDIPGELWKVEGDKLYFSSKYHLDKVELLEYNLRKHTYKKVKTLPFQNQQYLVAPNLKHGLKPIFNSNIKGEIAVINASGKELKPARVKYNSTLTGFGSNANGNVPVVWTDSAHFVYADYTIHENNSGYTAKRGTPDSVLTIEKTDTDTLPCCSARLTEVNIYTGQKRHIATLSGLYMPFIDDKLTVAESTLLFRNLSRRHATLRFCIHRFTGAISNYEPGSGEIFTTIRDTLHENIDHHPATVLYKGNAIGRFNINEMSDTGDLLAVYGKKTGDTDYLLHCWHPATGAWQQLPIKSFLDFKGWIDLDKW